MFRSFPNRRSQSLHSNNLVIFVFVIFGKPEGPNLRKLRGYGVCRILKLLMYYSNQVEGHKGIFHRVERELTTVVLVYQPTVLFPLRKVFSHPVAIALKVLDFPLKGLRPPQILEEFKVV